VTQDSFAPPSATQEGAAQTATSGLRRVFEGTATVFRGEPCGPDVREPIARNGGLADTRPIPLGCSSSRRDSHGAFIVPRAKGGHKRQNAPAAVPESLRGGGMI
jgi:hypothetical protein